MYVYVYITLVYYHTHICIYVYTLVYYITMLTEEVGQWTWIDPGAFALVGAGAFMGGVTRLTVCLAVIMIEVSSDVHMLLPVLVATMTVSGVCCTGY